MRTPRECTAEPLIYRLRVEVDGRLVTERTVKASGLRGDRPLSVEEDLAVAPGERAVDVSFVPLGSEGRARRFQGRVEFTAGRIRLVTSHDDGLVVR
jgi:hypothetical protein